MNNAITQKFNFWSLMKFTFPTIVMMIFFSLYTIVDGIFVSRLVGTDALSAVNIVYPIISVTYALGVMLGTGGSAIIGKKLGEGKFREAKENFSLILVAGFFIGLLVMIPTVIFIRPILYMIGANEAVYQLCYEYAWPILFFLPLSILQVAFQYYFVTAGKPNAGLALTIAGGLANIVLDYVLIAVLDMGIAGAAYGTGLSYCIPAIIGLVYFLINRKGLLYFVKPKLDWKVLISSCTNGSSEMVTNLSTSVITILFNLVMMHYLGEAGVAAISIVLYAEFVLIAIYLGFSSGVAPIISYNYGDKNWDQLKKIFRYSMIFILCSCVLMFTAAMLLAPQMTNVFVSKDDPVFALTLRGFYLYSFAYIFKGINIFASALFTAYSNGKISALLSFMRTLVFIMLAMFLLTRLFEADGAWLAVPAAELASVLMSGFFIWKYKFVYRYA